MDRLQSALLPTVGRVIMGLIFAMSGFGKLSAIDGTTGYIASVGLPAPTVAFWLAVALELGGGLLLVAGLMTRWVALAFAVFCVFTAFVFHGFGDMNNMINAMKNLALTGAFLYVAGLGAGPWSLDAVLGTRRGALAPA